MPTENRNDARSAIDKNPCGRCRTMGLAVCKGHGGGGGGGAPEDNEESSNIAPKNVPTPVAVKALSSYLEKSEVWRAENDFLYQFSHDMAVFSLELDLTKGILRFKGDEFLNVDDKKDLKALYDSIEDEFKTFIDEVSAQQSSFSRKGNNLIIKFSHQQLCDQFVTRLLNKNLIPTNKLHADLASKVNPGLQQRVEEKGAATSYQSPNPFDISKGPRPKGDFKGS